MNPIYLDNNSTAPLDESVKKAIVEELDFRILNPSSTHYYGQQAKGRLDRYRRKCADFFSVSSDKILFTGSATEAMNTLLHAFLKKRPGHVISSSSEHSCVYEWLRAKAPSVTFLNPGEPGVITQAHVEGTLTDKTALITLMAANNETGVLNDIEGIAEIAYRKNIPFIVDGVALLGKGSLPKHPGISAIVFSGHKIHAPPGVGMAILYQGGRFEPLLFGGPQEFNRRGGTENLPYIAAFAKALELIDPIQFLRMERLRDSFEEGLEKEIPGLIVHGQKSARVCNTSSLFFPDIEGEVFLARLDQGGVAASLGSACSSGAIEPSRTLLSMGLPPEIARSSLRFSLSRMNSEEEIAKALSIISRAHLTSRYSR